MKKYSNQHTKGAVPGRPILLHFVNPLRPQDLAQPFQIRLAAGFNLNNREFRSHSLKLLHAG